MNNLSNVMDWKLLLGTSEFSARCTSGNIRLLQSRANELVEKNRQIEIPKTKERNKGNFVSQKLY